MLTVVFVLCCLAVSCWTVAVPAMRTRDAFQFARKFASPDALAHLKRVKSTAKPGQSQAATTATSVIEILLFPTAALAASELQAALAAAPLGEYLCEPPWEAEAEGGREFAGRAYATAVPAGTARTQGQVDEWGEVWPVQIVHLREGAGARVRQKGWERAKVGWLEKEAGEVWARAREAGERGEVSVRGELAGSDVYSDASSWGAAPDRLHGERVVGRRVPLGRGATDDARPDARHAPLDRQHPPPRRLQRDRRHRPPRHWRLPLLRFLFRTSPLRPVDLAALRLRRIRPPGLSLPARRPVPPDGRDGVYVARAVPAVRDEPAALAREGGVLCAAKSGGGGVWECVQGARGWGVESQV